MSLLILELDFLVPPADEEEVVAITFPYSSVVSTVTEVEEEEESVSSN